MKKNHLSNFKQRRARPARGPSAQEMKPAILKAVLALTPAACPECSSAEVAGELKDIFSRGDVHSAGLPATKCHVRQAGRMLSVYKAEGLVTCRKKSSFALWKLTPEGREYLERQK